MTKAARKALDRRERKATSVYSRFRGAKAVQPALTFYEFLTEPRFEQARSGA